MSIIIHPSDGIPITIHESPAEEVTQPVAKDIPAEERTLADALKVWEQGSEGVRLKAEKDPVASGTVYDVGYGFTHLIDKDGKKTKVTKDTVLKNTAEADVQLGRWVDKVQATADVMVPASLKEHRDYAEFNEALASVIYNTGAGAFPNSKEFLKEGKIDQAIKGIWGHEHGLVRADGKKLTGLIKRRNNELRYMLGHDDVHVDYSKNNRQQAIKDNEELVAEAIQRFHPQPKPARKPENTE